MEERYKKKILFGLVALAIIILIGVGSTFAYFTANASSNENAINMQAGKFTISLEEDATLLKSNLIPTIEDYVDIASIRVDLNGDFLKPYEDEDTHNLITTGTACIDDNLREICSIYTFTIKNSSSSSLPLYITLSPAINTFENLYFKVLDSNKNEVIGATHLVDDRPYVMNGDIKEYDAESTISPVVLTDINTTIDAAIDADTPSAVTYSLVLWIMENNKNQNTSDGGKSFAAGINVTAGSGAGQGITGVFGTGGIED